MIVTINAPNADIRGKRGSRHHPHRDLCRTKLRYNNLDSEHTLTIKAHDLF